MQSKACRTCGKDKVLADFGVDKSRQDGRYASCRSCDRAYRATLAQRRQTRQHAARAARADRPDAPVAGERAATTAATDFRQNPEVLATFAAIVAIGEAGGLPPNMVWTGPSGSGKTEAAKDLARRAGLPFYKVDAPSMTDPEAWFGTREVVVVDGAPQTVVNHSAFVAAVQQPCILLIDEGNRVSDAVRQILLGLWDDSRQVTNPLTGQPLVRHPQCYIVMTANVGLLFTGTFAVDPAFYTRSVTTRFSYLDAAAETALAVSRTRVDRDTAALFVRFAGETRQRAATNEDFPPISTREVLTACALVRHGLDANTAAHQVVINAAAADGGAESVQGQLSLIWTGIRPKA